MKTTVAFFFMKLDPEKLRGRRVGFRQVLVIGGPLWPRALNFSGPGMKRLAAPDALQA
jgi:hypothetical protein